MTLFRHITIDCHLQSWNNVQTNWRIVAATFAADYTTFNYAEK